METVNVRQHPVAVGSKREKSRWVAVVEESRLSANLVMMKAVLAFLVLFVSFNVGYGLKCYACVSTKSWGDCEDVKKEITCSSETNRCAKIYEDVKKGGVSAEGYAKGCLSEKTCSNLQLIDECKDGGKCEVSCCSSDLCNAAPLKVMSTFILLTCVLFALIQ